MPKTPFKFVSLNKFQPPLVMVVKFELTILPWSSISKVSRTADSWEGGWSVPIRILSQTNTNIYIPLAYQVEKVLLPLFENRISTGLNQSMFPTLLLPISIIYYSTNKNPKTFWILILAQIKILLFHFEEWIVSHNRMLINFIISLWQWGVRAWDRTNGGWGWGWGLEIGEMEGEGEAWDRRSKLGEWGLRLDRWRLRVRVRAWDRRDGGWSEIGLLREGGWCVGEARVENIISK